MIKVLFLDCDGVLNRRPTKEELDAYAGHWTVEFENAICGLNPELVKNLMLVLDETGASLVMSTSWRYFDDHPTVGRDWRKTLAEMLNRDRSVFKGDTPILEDPDIMRKRRGSEIKAWIENNLEPGKFKYCVVDDNVDDIVGVIPGKNVVKTDERFGLTPEIARKIIGVFNG